VNGFRRERDVRTPPSDVHGPSASSGGRGYQGSFDFDEMIASLHDLFTNDRQVASQGDGKRCGICYLHFPVNELVYREEEGFYVCVNCTRTMGKQTLPMLRRQQK